MNTIIAILLVFGQVQPTSQPTTKYADISSFVSTSKMLLFSKKYDEAKVLLSEALSKNPEDREARCIYAQCFDKQGDVQNAINEYRKVLMPPIPPNCPEAVTKRAIEALAKLDEGMKIVKRHVDELKKDAETYKQTNSVAYQTLQTAIDLLANMATSIKPQQMKAQHEVKENKPEMPKTALSFGKHHYKRYDEKRSWHGAKTECEKLGGHLVTIGSQQESEFVTNMVAGKFCLVGATDEVNEGEWLWIDGTKWGIYTNFGAGEPNNGLQGVKYSQDFLMIRSTGLWDDVTNTDPYQNCYVCEWDY